MKNKKIVITAIAMAAIMTFSMTSVAFGTGIMMPLSGWCEPVTELGYQVVDAWFYVCDNIDPRITALESKPELRYSSHDNRSVTLVSNESSVFIYDATFSSYDNPLIGFDFGYQGVTFTQNGTTTYMIHDTVVLPPGMSIDISFVEFEWPTNSKTPLGSTCTITGNMKLSECNVVFDAKPYTGGIITQVNATYPTITDGDRIVADIGYTTRVLSR